MNHIRRAGSSLTLAVLVLCWVAQGWVAAPAWPETGTDRLIFGAAGEGARPRQLVWAPDGKRLSYIWTREGRNRLELLDVVEGETKELFLLEDLAADGSPGATSISRYRWSPDGNLLVVESGDDLFLFSIGERKLELYGESLIQITAQHPIETAVEATY